MKGAGQIRKLLKAELPFQSERILEPKKMFTFAARNGFILCFAHLEDLRRVYDFQDLQSFRNHDFEGFRGLPDIHLSLHHEVFQLGG